MKVLFFLFILIMFFPTSIQAQESKEVANITKIEVDIVSKISLNENLEFLIDRNDPTFLNNMTNPFREFEEKLKECEIDKCLILTSIDDTLKNIQKIEKDNSEGFPLFQTLAIILPILTGVIGLISGEYISQNKERKKNRKELEKIQMLLKSDFSTIYRMIIHQEKLLSKHLHNIEKKDGMFQIVNVFNNMKNPLEKNEYTKFIKDMKLILKFVYWDIIERSGSLIKLEPSEIKTINIAHDLMVNYRKQDDEDWKKFFNKFSDLRENNKIDESKIEQLKLYSIAYLNISLKTINSIKIHLQLVNTIDWMNLQSEITSNKDIEHILDKENEEKI